MKKLFTLLFAAASILGNSQGYQNATASYGINVLNTGAISFGAGTSFYDFNNDGRDDLTYCTSSDSIVFFISEGDSFTRVEILGNTVDAKQPTWVDYDNDGDADLMVTKRNSGTKLYRNDGWPNFTDVTDNLNMPMVVGVNSFGNAWADYDKDGDLDVYICNRNINEVTNWLCKNNGDGTFQQVANDAGVSNTDNYCFQAVWCDFNNDTWLDLYVANDLNTGNTMYFNNGDGTFQEVGVATNTNLAIEAMCATVGDYDNDNDFDIYVANIATGNFLLQNDGTGVFTNVAAAAGLSVNMMTWGTQWVDFDNDTDLDIHMVTTNGGNNQNPFYVNNGDGTFTLANELGFAGDATNAYSNAIGDFNNDGFYDITHTTVGSQNSYTLWENLAVGGNSIKINLTGTESNKDGIGSRIDYWIDGQQYSHFSSAGGGFISQCSDNYILGMGDASQIDSLQILWPLGMPEMYYNLQAGSINHFIEGATYNYAITTENNNVLCNELILDAGERPNYMWDDGTTDRYRTVTAAGTYTSETTFWNGYVYTTSIDITQGYIPNFDIDVTNATCNGDSNGAAFIDENTNASISILYNESIVSNPMNNLVAGEYAIVVTSEDGCITEDAFTINQPDAIVPTIETTNVSCFGGNDGTAVFSATGGNTAVTASIVDADATQLEAGTYNILFFDQLGCWTQESITITEPSQLVVLSNSVTDAFNGNNGSIEIEIAGGTEPYTYAWSNGDEDALAENIGQGDFSCVITDNNGCTVSFEESIIDLTIESAETSFNISVYPNPSNGILFVRSNAKNKIETVLVFDALGNLVSNLALNASSGMIDTSSWAQGIYTIQVKSANSISTEKIIIE